MSYLAVPKFVIDDWKNQYSVNSDVFTQYGLSVEEQSTFLELVARDEEICRNFAFANAKKPEGRNPIYLATAGAPLAGKSTELDRAVQDKDGEYYHTVRIDPDVWTMKTMIHSYQGHMMSQGLIADADSFKDAQIKAYDLCRPASNYYSLENMNEAVERKLDIAHGTTMTSEHAGKMLDNYKNNGYDIHLIVVAAPDDIRGEASSYRQKTQANYQSTPEDVISKGAAFHDRMSTYFEKADKLVLKWRTAVQGDAEVAAIYENGQKTVVNEEAYNDFVTFYQGDMNACEQTYAQKFVIT